MPPTICFTGILFLPSGPGPSKWDLMKPHGDALEHSGLKWERVKVKNTDILNLNTELKISSLHDSLIEIYSQFYPMQMVLYISVYSP